jgi:signal transduction histidine kinase
MRRIKRGDEPTGEGEYEVAPHTIHWLNLPVTANGNPLGRLLVLRDVTEERLLERMREDLTHMMVHDLRNPVTSIYGWLTLLQQSSDDLSEAQNRMVESGLVSVDKLSELINNILSVSQLEGGQVPLVRRPVSLADLIAEACHAQQPQAIKKGLHVRRDVMPGLPPVWADARLIGRVLQNLIDNAIKFTPAGGSVTVTVGPTHATDAGQASEQEAHAHYLRISVSDSGPGIPPELQRQLFQKFATGRQEASGSGLGLAFCKLAVEAHGGSIWVESEPEQGATFSFTLPIAQEDEITTPGVSKTPSWPTHALEAT